MLQRGGRETRRQPRRWRTDNWSVRLVATLGIFGVLAVPGTYASWIDSVPVTGTVLTAGTVDLRVENSDSVTGWNAMNTTTLEPGDSTAAVLTVTNNGTAPLNYYVDATASNGDGKGLGTTLTAKVTQEATTTGSAPNVRCAGTSVGGTSFSAGLAGSAANPLQVPGGTSRKLCIQAAMPVGTIAQGARTNIDLTFHAFTGTTGDRGWTDTVPLSGITLGTVHAFYLGNVGAGDTPYAESNLTLRRTGPTRTTLFNYDTTRDSQAGLVLLKGNGNPTKEWFTLSPPLSSPLAISGTARLRLWSAVRGFSTTAEGQLRIELYDCNSTGSSCTSLHGSSHTLKPWNSTGDWSRMTFPLLSGSHTFAQDRTIKLMLSATQSSSDDMMIAYDTTTYRSGVIIE